MHLNQDAGPSEAAPPAIDEAAAALHRGAVFFAAAKMPRSPRSGVVGTRFRQQVACACFLRRGLRKEFHGGDGGGEMGVGARRCTQLAVRAGTGGERGGGMRRADFQTDSGEQIIIARSAKKNGSRRGLAMFGACAGTELSRVSPEHRLWGSAPRRSCSTLGEVCLDNLAWLWLWNHETLRNESRRYKPVALYIKTVLSPLLLLHPLSLTVSSSPLLPLWPHKQRAYAPAGGS